LIRVVLMLALLSLSLTSPAMAWLPPDPMATPGFEEILNLENARNIGPRLQALAHDKSPLIRARALRALGRAQDASLAPLFAGLLKDGEAAVRDEAALAMGLLWEKGDEVSLIEAFGAEKDPAVRRTLVEAVGRCGTTGRGVPFLAGLAENADPLIARQACLAIGICGYRKVPVKPAEQALGRASRSPDAGVRWAATYGFLRGVPQQAPLFLRPLLKDADPLVRAGAARALAAGKRKDQAAGLADLLRDPDWRVRVEALKAMPLVDGQQFVSVMSLAVEDPVPLVQIAGIEALGQMKVNIALAYLSPIIEEVDDWRLRSAAIVARTRLVGDGALPDLQRYKDSSEWQIRRAVAEALGLVQSDQGREILAQMITDQNPQVLSTVATSLQNYPQVMALDGLQALLHSDDMAVITNAASALGQRSDRSAIQPLVDTWHRLKAPGDLEPMMEILRALGNILVPPDTLLVNGALTPEGKKLALATLEEGLRDPDRNVALAAAEGLQRMDGRDRSAEVAAASTGTFPLYLDEIKAPKARKARIVTRHGNLVIEFLPGEAPNTVANFVHLAGQGFYDNLNFHRVVPGFVTQDGCPRGDGWGSPGYQIRCEYNDLHYDSWMVGMVLTGKDTGGSQYFITQAPQPHLDGRYTIFARLVEGMDLLPKMLVGEPILKVELIP
jgi:cyclophilin family peptidyl-prolyl cis-trans isomerase/HEAT repeat protein